MVATPATVELSQARIRVVVAAVASAIFLIHAFLTGAWPSFGVALVYLAVSLGLLLATRAQNVTPATLRCAALLIDVAAVALISMLNPGGAEAFYPAFLAIAIDHGLRFRQPLAMGASALTLAGYTVALAATGSVWLAPMPWIGLAAMLLLFPQYLLHLTATTARRNAALRSRIDAAAFAATHDALTGLANHAALQPRLEQAIARARRSGSELTVVVFDIDAFAAFNQASGRTSGDRVLTRLAGALVGAVRDSDTVARSGDDEFVVVVEETDQGPGGEVLIERLFSCLHEIDGSADGIADISCGCGVAVFPRDASEAGALVDRARDALLAAKALGPNRYAFYDPQMSRTVSDQLALRDALLGALDREELAVDFQPIIDVRTGRVCAAEALLRWQHPQRGRLAAAEFIDVADRTGLIIPIGRWVLAEALQMAAQWRQQVGSQASLHVNVSWRQLREAGFVDEVRSLLALNEVPPESLVIEIDETSLARTDAKVTQCLVAIRALGVQVALDRFGSGASSLAALKDLPIDVIKLGEVFVAAIPASQRDCAVSDSVLTLADRLEHALVATHVETAGQREWLVTHGCRYLQGNLFGEPCTSDAFLDASGRLHDTAPTLQLGNRF